VGEELRAAGDRWQEAALLLQEAAAAPEPTVALGKAAAVLESVATLEQAAWEKLARIVD
jgi:hypothetical protein